MPTIKRVYTIRSIFTRWGEMGWEEEDRQRMRGGWVLWEVRRGAARDTGSGEGETMWIGANGNIEIKCLKE